MRFITEILSVKLLLLIYLFLALPWVLTTQARIKKLFGSRLSTVLILMRCVLILAVLSFFVGLTVILSRGPGGGKVILLEDHSLSMMLPESAQTTAVRAERAARIVDKLMSMLDGEWEVERLWFGTATARMDDAAGERSITGSTDIIKSLKEAVSLADYGSQCVLVTDGRVTMGQSVSTRESKLSFPVHTVLVGDKLDRFDASIVSLTFPEPVYQAEEVPVKLLVFGYGPGTAQVELAAKLDGRGIEKRMLNLTGDAARVEVPLVLPAMDPGMHLVEVSLIPKGEEFTRLNNKRSVYIKVMKSKRSLSFYSNSPDWDFAYLKRCLESSHDYQMKVLVEAAPGRAASLEGADRYVNEPLDQFTSSIEASELIVLHGDLGNIPEPIRRALRAKLSGDGVGMLLMPTVPWHNERSWEEIKTLCPYPAGVDRVSTGKAPAGYYGLSPNPVISPGLGSDFDEWDQLPPFQQILIGTVLADGFKELLRSEIADNVTVPAIVATEWNGGRGIVFLASGFWKWDMFPVQFGKGPYFRKIMEGITKWLSEPSSLLSSACEPMATSVRRGDGISFIRSKKLGKNKRIEVEITAAEGTDSLWKIDFGEAGEIQSEEMFLDPGLYRYSAYEPGEGVRREIGKGSFLVDESSVEFDDPRPDPGMLEVLSRESGGSMVDVEGLASLVKDLGSLRNPESKSVRVDFRRKPSVYLAVLLIFFMELFVRRRRGLP
ncbi:MAG: hypothetical protein ACE5OP_03970 [Candidatus Glassbacteria bacterium]